ncbi:MAG TPA: hypothetical protein EYN06_09300 [Myxococcales bacterium]|jgi:hypothetical protein|nr:hypothetical protein [Myxococcales bacterium]
MKKMLKIALAGMLFIALTGVSTASAQDLPDPRGVWAQGNNVLKFTGKNIKRGRFTVEVDYMGMRVSSRGRWTQKKAGLLTWKLTDINLGGRPGDSAMLPKAGDYMYGLFKRVDENTMKLFYKMKGYGQKSAADHPKAGAINDAKTYKKK